MRSIWIRSALIAFLVIGGSKLAWAHESYSQSGTTGEYGSCSDAQNAAESAMWAAVQYGYTVGSWNVSGCAYRPRTVDEYGDATSYWFQAQWTAQYVKNHRHGPESHVH